MSAGEFALIEWLRARSPVAPPILTGIGDDAAVIDATGVSRWLVTTDMLMDGVDFDLAAGTPPELAGRKALAVNLSDIAAMAGVPHAAFVSLALPRAGGRALAEGLYRGMQPLLEEFEVTLAGGDTNSWDGPLVISVTLLGSDPKPPVLRDGATPGDWLMVTGALGGSLSGRHLTFQPRVNEAIALRNAVPLHAMCDVSDGIASDVRHLVNPRAAGVVLDATAIPIHDDVDAALPSDRQLACALGDGEDFELLFAVSPEAGARLLVNPPVSCGMTRIGEFTAEPGARLRDPGGVERRLTIAGWEHELRN